MAFKPVRQAPACEDPVAVLTSAQLWESVILFVKDRPWMLLSVSWWAFRGRHCVAARVSRHVRLDSSPPLDSGEPQSALATWRAALRVYQWSKNLLVFVPVLTAHRIFEPSTLLRVGQMFLAVSCAASGMYILNDLLDIPADRRHLVKCRRPFASARLPIQHGLLAAPLLFALGVALAAPLGLAAIALLVLYALVSFAYSLRLKLYAPLDVFVLSGLYTLRIIMGGVATHIWLSGWLLSFSVFLFLSLAFGKRFAELVQLRIRNVERHEGRGYVTADAELLAMFGVCSGFISCLVLAFYIDSAQVRVLYRQPDYLWLLLPVLLFWLAKVWLAAWRGQLDEDPVLFAIRSPFTYGLGCLSLLLLILASLDPLTSWLHGS
jgi:4-hydroxybenzoate polyprenyltransferase